MVVAIHPSHDRRNEGCEVTLVRKTTVSLCAHIQRQCKKRDGRICTYHIFPPKLAMLLHHLLAVLEVLLDIRMQLGAVGSRRYHATSLMKLHCFGEREGGLDSMLVTWSRRIGCLDREVEEFMAEPRYVGGGGYGLVVVGLGEVGGKLLLAMLLLRTIFDISQIGEVKCVEVVRIEEQVILSGHEVGSGASGPGIVERLGVHVGRMRGAVEEKAAGIREDFDRVQRSRTGSQARADTHTIKWSRIWRGV